MIELSFLQNEQEEWLNLVMTGHAEYADQGQDIVCAAVSALVISTVNNSERLLDIEPNVEMNQDQSGYMRIDVSEFSQHESWRDLQLLLDALYWAVKDIEQEYPKNIRVYKI